MVSIPHSTVEALFLCYVSVARASTTTLQVDRNDNKKKTPFLTLT